MGARAWAGRAAPAGGSVREDAAMPARRDAPGNTACTLNRATAVYINASNTRGPVAVPLLLRTSLIKLLNCHWGFPK